MSIVYVARECSFCEVGIWLGPILQAYVEYHRFVFMSTGAGGTRPSATQKAAIQSGLILQPEASTILGYGVRHINRKWLYDRYLYIDKPIVVGSKKVNNHELVSLVYALESLVECVMRTR